MLYKLIEARLVVSRDRSGGVIVSKLVVNIVGNQTQIEWRIATRVFRCRLYTGLWVNDRLCAVVWDVSISTAVGV